MSRVSSGYSWSPNTGIGSSPAADSTSSSCDEHLDLTGRQVRVHGLRRPRLDRAVDPDHPLRAHLLRRLEGRRIRIGHDLGQAVMVAEVDEQQPAMVADAVHPAGQADGLADVVGRSAPQVWVR